MNSITINDVDDTLRRQLSVRAAERGHSIEEEAREILKTALEGNPPSEEGFGTVLHEMFKSVGGVDLEIPGRDSMRQPPHFN